MMEGLVVNLKKAAAKRIQGNSWMGDATKKAALTKLAKMDVMVGYPDKFRDYSKLTMKPDDLYGNIKRSAAFEWAYPARRSQQAGRPQEMGDEPGDGRRL